MRVAFVTYHDVEMDENRLAFRVRKTSEEIRGNSCHK